MRSTRFDEREVVVDESGLFTVDGLTPGPADVLLQYGHGDDVRRLTVPAVFVVSGEIALDDRLDGVDLISGLRTSRVTVLGPEGRPVPLASVGHRPHGSDVPWTFAPIDRKGVASVVSTADELDLCVNA